MTRIKKINTHELAWMAGIFDLKGRFTTKINRTRKTPQVVLYVETKNEAIIRRLSGSTGMSPEMRDAKPLKDFMRKGCDTHCPEPHVHIHPQQPEGTEELMMPPMARWTITGVSIVIIANNVTPYLCTDNQMAYREVAATIKAVTPLTGQGSGTVVSAIRRLAFLGWTLPEEYESVLEN